MTAKELPGDGARSTPKKAAKKAATKAAKKVAKKAAKKGARKAAKKSPGGPGHDLRRAYEHLHRLHVLARFLPSDELIQLRTLSQYAGAALRAEQPRTGADLLRAAEHLAFAALSREADNAAPAPELVEDLREAYEHLRERAAAAWEAQDPAPARALRALYSEARGGAKGAWKVNAFHRAMEFARAADALAHAAAGDVRLPVEEGKRATRLP